MPKPVIIAIVGLMGSGKTEATSRFIERGFTRVGFNDIIYEELERRGMARTPPNEKVVREGLRKEFGMGVAAERSLSKITEALKDGRSVAIESLYSWSEYKIVKERWGGQFKVLAIYAPPKIRYARLTTRPIRPLNETEAKSRDYAEIENIEKAGPVAMADWTIQNLGDKKDFFSAVDNLIDEIVSSG